MPALEQEIKTYGEIAESLSKHMVNPKHFVATVEKLFKIIQKSEGATVEGFKKIKKITDSLQSSIDDVSMGNKTLKKELQKQLDILKESISKIKLQKGDKGDDAKAEDVAATLKRDIQFIESLRGADGDLKELSPEETRNNLELLIGDERLDKRAVRGIEDIEKDLNEVKSRPTGKGSSGPNGVWLYVGGAKKGLLKTFNLKAGTGMTLVHTIVNGMDTITFTSNGGSGAGIAFEEPTGDVDDSNTTFTVLNDPEYIVINGAQYFEGTGTYQSYNSGTKTITLSSPVGTGGFIRSGYAA